jgi:carbonic anhydrase
MPKEPSLLPSDALKKLMEGNARFVAGAMSHDDRINDSLRKELSGGQAPFASILTCSDSRTSPAHLFDAGLGELFICRNAGNLLTDVDLGSFEYAAAHTGCPLLMVLGHSSCGAVGAAVASFQNPGRSESPHIDAIVRRILPSVIDARPEGGDTSGWVDAAAKQNVIAVCRQVTQRSDLLKDRIDAGRYRVVGAWYDLASGEVSIIEEP